MDEEMRQPLESQLARAGIFSTPGDFPLAGDSAVQLFSALDLAVGSDYLERAFTDWAVLLEQYGWDGSFDGIAWVLQNESRPRVGSISGENYLNGLHAAFAAPFLLLDRWRQAEKEYAGRLAKIRAENEELRQTLNQERTARDDKE